VLGVRMPCGTREAETGSPVALPFFTTKPPGSGTGLGLNISHTIVVRKHDGRMSVETEPGRTC
jgi:two-component system NtrC family sensor kinase